MQNRNWLRALALVAAGSTGYCADTAGAQSWPNRPLTMVVPFATGSSSDTIGRLLAPRLSASLGAQVIVESVSGAGGMTGTAKVAKSPPDGYQFVLASVDSIAIVPAMHKSPSYNSLTDLVGAGLAVELPILLVTRKDFPANSLEEFVTYARANHRTMQFGSAGVGSGSHFSCAQLNAALGIEPVHIPYRGGNLAMQDLVAGRIDFACPLAAAAMSSVEGNNVKTLSLLTSERSPLFPALKTAEEQGVSGINARFWMALFFSKDTPAAIVTKVSLATNAALSDPVMVDRLGKIGASPAAPAQRSAEGFEKFMAAEVASWAKTVKASGVTID